MIRRALTWIAVLATVGGAVFIANAVAQDSHSVKAVDPFSDPPAETFLWDPDSFEAEEGDVVSFEFDQAGFPHNIVVRPPDDSRPKNEGLINLGEDVPTCNLSGDQHACPPGHDPITYTVGPEIEDGNILYICTLHAGYNQATDEWTGMVGEIGDPDPDLDPRMENPTEIGADGPDGEGWETGTEPAEIRNVRVAALQRGIRLRMNVSHPGRVNVRLRRGGRIHVNQNRTGLSPGFNQRWINRRALTQGRYNVVIRYFDRWGIQGEPRVVRRQVRFR